MPFKLLITGKTVDSSIIAAMEIFISRIRKYHKLTIDEITVKKGVADLNLQKKSEAVQLLSRIRSQDHVILLDEKGKEYSSVEFSGRIEKIQIQSAGDIVFVIGGAHGFDVSVYNRANELLSLSKMTFTHQMVRLIFIEQLYRAFTIINNENYHH